MKRFIVLLAVCVLLMIGCATQAVAEKKADNSVVQSAETKVLIMEIEKEINQKLETLKGLGQAQFIASMNFLAAKHEIERIKVEITQLQNRAKLLMTPPKVEKKK